MKTAWKRHHHALANERGITLVELLVAVVAASIVIVGIGSFYVRMQDSYNQDNVQSVMQRRGTVIQEEITRIVLASNAMLAGTCGPSGTVGNSLTVRLPADALPDNPWGAGAPSLALGGVVCLFLNANQLSECHLNSETDRTCRAFTTRNLLGSDGTAAPATVLGGRQTNPPTNLTTGTTFDVFSVIGGAAVEVRFRLATRSLTDPLVGPLDFTMRATAKNG